MEQHHHRSTTKVSHKPFKPRFTSKNALKDRAKGKVESFDRGARKTPHQQVMSKLDRRNQAKQKRLAHREHHAKAFNVFAGQDGASRVVAVVPLCFDVVVEDVIKSLNKSLDIYQEVSAGPVRVDIHRFKQKITYLPVPRDIVHAMDIARVADYVLLVFSATQAMDDQGENIVRCIEGQGISNVYSLVQGLDKQPPKQRTDILKSLRTDISYFFPSQEKVYCLDAVQELQNLLRSLCTTLPVGIKWREDRSWMLAEEAQFIVQDHQAAEVMVVITGVVRGRNLKADRLLRVGDWGEFRIDKITDASRTGTKSKDSAMVIDTEAVLDVPGQNCDTLDELAPEEVVMEDVDTLSTAPSDAKGVLIDDEHYYSGDEDEEEAKIPKRLPKGTSKYQAAWYLDDASDSGSDFEDADSDIQMADVTPADGLEGTAPAPETEAATEYAESEMFADPSPEEEAQEIEAYRSRRKVAEDDLHFPDEIELSPNVSARERLAKYRGLKSLRTSPWNTQEDALYRPEGWTRLLDISDYRGARNRVLSEALVGGVKAGTRVNIHLTVPSSLQKYFNPSKPLACFSLLRHEHKNTASNFTFTLDSSYPEPLKSKEEIIVQCGPRRFSIKPMFSQQGNTPNDVHKFERYLHPGRTAVATFTGPLTWGSVPALFFKAKPSPDGEKSELLLIGRGTCLPASTSRIIAKRIVLTGEPYRINRRLVTVRYMFFNTEDLAWFKALRLWTNRGRQGEIKESLGTHGHFKAMFDAKIGMQDAIGVSLYKRVWPREARMLGPGEV